MGDAAANKRVAERFWQALYARDWDAIAGFFAEDAHYEDVPAPDPGADGPANIVRRLKIGLEPIERQEHAIHRMLGEGDTVVTEHTETWHFDADHVVALPFVSIHVFEEERIALWRDYWDLGTLLSAAPPWWLERLASHSADDFR